MKTFFNLATLVACSFIASLTASAADPCVADKLISYGAAETWIPEYTDANIGETIGVQWTAPDLCAPGFTINGVSMGNATSGSDVSPLNPDCMGVVSFSTPGTYEAIITGGCGTVGAVAFTIVVSDGSGGGGDGVNGCTIASACNYMPEATVDDGSCTFAAFGFDCDGNAVGNGDVTLYTDAQLADMIADSVAAAIAAYAAQYETASIDLANQTAEAINNLDAEIIEHALTTDSLNLTADSLDAAEALADEYLTLFEEESALHLAALDQLAYVEAQFAGASQTISNLQGYVSYAFDQMTIAQNDLDVAVNTITQLESDLAAAQLALATAQSDALASLTPCDRFDSNEDGAVTTSDLIIFLGHFAETCD